MQSKPDKEYYIKLKFTLWKTNSSKWRVSRKVNIKLNNLKTKKSMKKVLKEVSKLVEKNAVGIVIITMIVSLLMLMMSSCNVTRIVKTEASHYQKGDTTTTIVTKTTETYEGKKIK